jgi:hypothetical protein
VGTISYSTTASQFSESVTGITGDYKIRIDNNTAARPVIDNLSFGSSTSYVTGYNANDVGNVSSHSISGLTTGETYYYVVRAYNACGSESSNSNEIEVNLTCTSPTTQASSFTSGSISSNSMTVGWTRGNGTAGVLVVARSGSAVNADPVSGTDYSANSAFGSGTQIGTGNYVVYKGSGNSVTITALSSSTTYHYAVMSTIPPIYVII